MLCGKGVIVTDTCIDHLPADLRSLDALDCDFFPAEISAWTALAGSLTRLCLDSVYNLTRDAAQELALACTNLVGLVDVCGRSLTSPCFIWRAGYPDHQGQPGTEENWLSAGCNTTLCTRMLTWLC
jgi:hypothetical protein